MLVLFNRVFRHRECAVALADSRLKSPLVTALNKPPPPPPHSLVVALVRSEHVGGMCQSCAQQRTVEHYLSHDVIYSV